jgi:hypothetical protein
MGSMIEIFLSYRKQDSVHLTDLLSAALADHFGRRHVFRDKDSLLLGGLYPGRIRDAMQRCDVMIAVIGPHWLDARRASGGRRIDDPADWVRMELSTAFRREIRVIPVLLDGTALPDVTELPADLRSLARSQYWQIRHQSVDSDIKGLIEKLDPGFRPSPDNARGGVANTQTITTGDGSTVVAGNGSGRQNVRMKRTEWR